jgi:hypothetical protein
MANPKQLTSAIVILVGIAVLDNFLFLESEQNINSMALVDAGALGLGIAEPHAKEFSANEISSDAFWIDKQQVSSSEYGEFIAATGHESADMNWSLRTATENPRQADSDATWQSDDSDRTRNSPADQAFAQVEYKDALAYCNWLNKELPTPRQIALASIDKSHNITIDNYAPYRTSGKQASFRCAKLIAHPEVKAN